MRQVKVPKHRSPRQLSTGEIANLVSSLPDAKCPLTDTEIAHWTARLRQPGAESEQRLKCLLTYWHYQAGSFCAAMAASALRLRVDQQLLEIAAGIDEIQSQLNQLPGEADAAIRIRLGDYDTILAAFSTTLRDIERKWDRPHRGQPSPQVESRAVALLIKAIEDFTGERFPSPASLKRLDEIEFARLLVARLFSSATSAQINTMLLHFHRRRREQN